MKTIHSIVVSITLFVSSISFVFGYNKAKDGTYYADFNGDGKHDIFLYDKTKGTGVVWGWDGNKWKTLWENNTFRKTWQVHLGDFDGNGKTDMFLYDKAKGHGVVLAIDGKNKSKAKTLWENKTFRKTWKMYVGNFTQNKKSELFLYDKKAGTGVIFGWDKTGKFKTLWENKTFRKTWDIYPGDVNGDKKVDLFLYDKKAGTGVLFGWDGKKTFKTFWENKTFRKTWNVFTMVK